MAITFYTSHRSGCKRSASNPFSWNGLQQWTNACTGSHRVSIVLAELNLPFEEVIIDLTTPRTAEYLAINPLGLVPALKWNGNVITESAIIAQFLVDAYPSHLLPALGTPEAALHRARVSAFADKFITKLQSQVFKFYSAKTDAAADAVVGDVVAAAVKEIEPLLSDAAPFFGGSEKLTFAEALTAPFAIRLVTLVEAGVLPSAVLEQLKIQAPNFYKWIHAVSQHPSVTRYFGKDAVIAISKSRIAKARE
ncbi:hypothetical protein HDU83_007720 [Entophlyctis luteolus]|nr:hypothetical protein HDU83_007720 [Entophlyctis luteolus]